MEVVAAVGGALLSVSFEKLFDMLASPELRQYTNKKEVQSQLQIWENMLPKIHAVLEDAEEKQTTSRLMGIWLSELRDLVYDVDDVLDEFSTEALRMKLKNTTQVGASTSSNKVKKLLPSLFTARSSSTSSGFKFNAEMGLKLKNITARMERICDEKSKLDLGDKAVGGVRSGWSDGTARLPTTSLPDSHVFGRDKDKRAILDLLLATEPTDAGGGGVSVIPIQGMGGSGKTTLAQLLYNDREVKVHFDLRAWVCVSDIFDILRITRTIIESFGIETRDGATLDQLQVKLRSILCGKKFFIVLDDVWNEKYEAWTALYKPLRGAPGSKIAVTTRNLGVASIMGTCKPYSLGELSFDDCLCLFAQHALGASNFDGHPDLKDVGGKIVGKCKGLPLAAKTLGGLLLTKMHLGEWVGVLESQIWDFPYEKSDILPALRLSYRHLPSKLKQCFAFCAIFPKDYEFTMNELVLLWIAEGFLPKLKWEKHKQDVGVEFFRDLLSRSFFQYSSKDRTKFVMHDLIHDLAQHVAGEICFHSDGRDKFPSSIQKVRHLSFTRAQYEVSGRYGVFGEGKGLRTLLALPNHEFDHYTWISSGVLNELLLKLKHLRALSLNNYQIREVPESFNGLNHLRYLNLSKTAIRLLPEFVCSLWTLQTLLLRECYELEKLPTSIGNLTNLWHLDINRTPKLIELPMGIGRLTDLQDLTKFIVGEEGGDRLNIRDMKGLSHLKGELSIQGLHKVEDFQQAREAQLIGKDGLERLVMEWNRHLAEEADSDVAAKVLELLQPHKNLKTLAIKFYCGRGFPSWIGDPLMMSNMVELKLCDCRKTTSLPSLGRLPLLKHLNIKGMVAIKRVGFEFYGCDSAFPALETLKFEDMLGWEKWCSSGSAAERDGKVKFPCLRELEILNCPLLIGDYKFSLPSLCQLKLKKCNELLLRCMIDLTSLTSLSIGEMSGLSCLHQSVEQRFLAFEDLEIYNCQDLTSLWLSGAWIEENSRCLRSLKVRSCPQLVSFFVAGSLSGEEEDEESCELPCNLVCLEIEDCCNFQKLPKKMASLEKMIVRKCQKIGSVQIEQQQEEGNDENGFLRKLRHVELEECGGQFIESMVNGLMMRLQGGGNSCVLDRLEIRSCDSIQHLGITSRRENSIVPTKLKCLRIEDCKHLVSLCNSEEGMVDQGEDIGIVEIESLEILNCPSLTTNGVKLPTVAVKSLSLSYCNRLESLPKEYIIMSSSTSSTSTLVELIHIWNCPNLRSLPDSLYSLTNLTSFSLNGSDGLEWFPESGLPIPNLKSLVINNCRSLKCLPKNMHGLASLETLRVSGCPSLKFLTEEQGCLPPNLIQLQIWECSNMKQSMSEWGLHTLTALERLSIGGVPQLPEDEHTLTCTLLLPSTLRTLHICGFKKVESITSSSWGIQNLTSLTQLHLKFFPKLKHLPREGFPPTLEILHICNCPILAKKCSEGKGKYWPLISLIPFVHVQNFD